MSIAEELGTALDAHLIEGLAGSAAFDRGARYMYDGRVQSVAEEDGRLRATVRGTMPYRVELWLDGDELLWRCTCPAAEDGSFCKHCTAVALSLLYADEPPDGLDAPVTGDSSERGGESEDTSIGRFVRQLDPERLAEIVLRQVAGNWRLREQLLGEARAAQGWGLDVSKWRRRINSAFDIGGFVYYQEAADWADGVNDVIDALADLADAGHGEDAVALVEHAYQRADKALHNLDDSDGWLTAIAERLAELHLRACEASSPDPRELAKRLTELELNFDLEAFCRSAQTYSEILGPTGLAAFREAIEPAWRQIDPAAEEWSTGDYYLRQAMIGWALAVGEPDALVEAHRRKRVHPVDMLEIAESFETAGRDDEAVTWARRGLAGLGHGSWQADGPRDFLARKLRERGEPGAAADLYWNAFTARPSLEAFRALPEQDQRAPDKRPDWVERCIRHLPRRLGTEAPEVSSLPPDVMGLGSPDAPHEAVVLAEILLYEGRAEEAWAAALQHGSSWQMWMTLARAREATAPRDSIAIYESQALAIINRKKPDQYKIAVGLMSRIRGLAADAGDPELFDSLLQQVKTVHKAKRRLQGELGDMAPLTDMSVGNATS
ncbi:MAG: SWIM zinc finger family protein [Acidimicrobiaceae bacterium]|nr:SWIM zinc finger family protein [Acidimicrobiaceae bacterium]